MESTKDEADIFNVSYSYGTDYSLFKNAKVIPRLTLSEGCLNNCKFCEIPHKIVIPVEWNCIEQQVLSFKELNFKLIYIDDKTFGQCDNYKCLDKLFKIIKNYNEEFSGFIVQTTTKEFLNKYKEFEKLHVKVVEIGMETYNDTILKLYNKPSSEKLLNDCVEVAKYSNLKIILNLIVGFPEETEESYIRTYKFLYENKNYIFGINPAIYTDYSSSKLSNGELYFSKNKNYKLNTKWWKIFNNFFKWK